MTNYAVFLHGENFRLSRDGETQLFGFFVTVRVEEISEADAQKNAIGLVKSDPELEEAFRSNNPESPDIHVK